jgi:hypothetical protein
MSVYVVRAFVQLRELLASNRALVRKLNEFEGKLKIHDEAIAAILSANSWTHRHRTATASGSPLILTTSRTMMASVASARNGPAIPATKFMPSPMVGLLISLEKRLKNSLR